MARIIFIVIISYIIAKLAGVVLRLLRHIGASGQPVRKPTSRNTGVKRAAPYSNVEDVDYEDISDKK